MAAATLVDAAWERHGGGAGQMDDAERTALEYIVGQVNAKIPLVLHCNLRSQNLRLVVATSKERFYRHIYNIQLLNLGLELQPIIRPNYAIDLIERNVHCREFLPS